MFLRNKIYILLFFLIISCQPVEIIDPVEYDNTKLDRISVNAKEKLINIKYNPVFSEENIEDQISSPPLKLINKWLEENINIFGNQNKLIIDILDASISKKIIENNDKKKYSEKTIFSYEVFFLVEYQLFDDNNYLLANTLVESSRSTTSQKYISLNETELIINDLLLKSLNDFIKESDSLIQTYMSEFIK